MLDLKIGLDCNIVLHINEAKDRLTRKRRVKKYTGLYVKNIFQYIEENCETNNLIKCGFCNSIKFFDYDFKIIENKLFLIYEYFNNLKICSRKDSEITRNCRSKLLNPNSIEMIKVAYEFNSDIEANEYLLKRNKSPFYKTNHKSEEEYKKYQRRDQEFYGSEELYKEKLKKISFANKKENVIKKYGEQKAKEILKKKDSSSKKHFQEKYDDEWEQYFNIKNFKTAGSLESFIFRYGEIIGEIKYNNFVETSRKNNKKFMESLTTDERSKLFGVASKKWHKQKYGNNWESYYKTYHEKTQCHRNASKESLKFFDKLIEKINNLNLNYYIGIEGNKEWFIYDSENHKFNLYDFCIKELKIIIEFHGSIWHYNPKFDYSKGLPFGMTVENHKISDQYKRELAELKGFDYYIVFDTDNYDQKVDYLYQKIIYKMNNLL